MKSKMQTYIGCAGNVLQKLIVLYKVALCCSSIQQIEIYCACTLCGGHKLGLHIECDTGCIQTSVQQNWIDNKYFRGQGVYDWFEDGWCTNVQTSGLYKQVGMHINQDLLYKQVGMHINQDLLYKRVGMHMNQDLLYKQVGMHINYNPIYKQVVVHTTAYVYSGTGYKNKSLYSICVQWDWL